MAREGRKVPLWCCVVGNTGRDDGATKELRVQRVRLNKVRRKRQHRAPMNCTSDLMAIYLQINISDYKFISLSVCDWSCALRKGDDS